MHGNKVLHNILSTYKKPILLFALINIPLLFYFWDYFNTNVILYGSSFLYLGLNPYFPGSDIVSAYFMLPYNLIAFLIYYFSNFSNAATYIFLKIIGLSIVMLCGMTLIRYFPHFNKTEKTAVLSALILNPFILFNNDVLVSTSLFPMFFSLLSYVLIFNVQRDNDLFLYLGTVSLLMAGFMYYFPLLILPTMIVYISPNIKRVKFLLVTVCIGVIFYIPSFLFHLQSTFTSTLTGGSPTMYPYSVLNLLPQHFQRIILHNELYITVLLILIAILIPIFLRGIKLSPAFSILLTLMIALLIQPVGTYPDSMIVIVPFVLIILLNSRSKKFTFLHSLLMQLFMLPEILVGQMLNGPGYVTGIFYSLFTTLHKSIVIFNLLPYAYLIWKGLIVCTLILAIISLIVLMKIDLGRTESDPKKEGFFRTPKEKSKRKVIAVVFSLLISLSLVAPVAFIHSPRLQNNVITSGNSFPVFLFIPVSPDGPYYLPDNNTYTISKSTVAFLESNGALYFYRNMNDQSYNFSFSVNYSFSGSSNTYKNVIILQTGVLTLSVDNLISEADINNTNRGTGTAFNVSDTLNGKNYIIPYSPKDIISISSGNYGSIISFGSKSYSTNVSSSNLSFGKLSASPVVLKFSSLSLKISPAQNDNNYQLVVLFASVLSPTSAFLVFCFYRNRR